jgi:hypothetical protein
MAPEIPWPSRGSKQEPNREARMGFAYLAGR